MTSQATAIAYAQIFSKENIIFNTSGYPIEPPKVVTPRKAKVVATNRSANTAQRCSCVLYVKSINGYSRPVGYARNWPINTTIPQVGATVVTREGPIGHVAYVTGIQNGFLILSESNYRRCTVTHGRKLSITSPLIKGYYVR